MAERAGLFEEDLDLSTFTPKTSTKAEPAAEAIREVSEKVNFQSREPVAKSAKKADRRHRTGRNEQLNLKVKSEAKDLFYRINDAQGWVQGYTFERAVAALQRELDVATLDSRSGE
jgi:hypothetical protein